MIILSTHKTEISSKRTSLIISKICTYYFREFKTGQFVMRVNPVSYTHLTLPTIA